MQNFIDIYDIYDYYTPPFWQTFWFKFSIATVIIAVAVLIGVYVFFMKRKVVTPREWLEAQINKLSQQSITSSKDGKQLYFTLTALIKEYLHKEYHWKILDQTDKELAQWLKKENVDTHIIDTVDQIAQNALLIKFANVQALKAHIDSDLAMVRNMLNQTKQLH